MREPWPPRMHEVAIGLGAIDDEAEEAEVASALPLAAVDRGRDVEREVELAMRGTGDGMVGHVVAAVHQYHVA